MTSDVPPGARCTADGCDREGVDPQHPAPRCERHLPGSAGEDPDVEGDDAPGFNLHSGGCTPPCWLTRAHAPEGAPVLAPEPTTSHNRNAGSDAGVDTSTASYQDGETPDGDGAVDTVESDHDSTLTSNGTKTRVCPDDDPDAVEAFADAVAYFRAHLDDDLPSDVDVDVGTPREYFENRGLEPDTVEAAGLGYAPADGVGLLDHLMRRGHDREAILGTGLFWSDGLDPIWMGRYVFPYFDAQERPVYAISRRLEPPHPADGAGKYGADDDPAKYHKIPDREHTVVDEPIYGIDSLEAGKPVVITEGIADAIAAHEAGYPALSPVTVQFKHKHREALARILEERDVGRVVVVQDAEPPSVEKKDVDDVEAIGDALAITQYGEGLRGAVDTAAHLREHGVEAYLAELPRPGLNKVDLDDYIHEWGDTWGLAPLLASAAPPEQHRAFDPKRAAVASTPDVPTSAGEDADDGKTSDGSGSAGSTASKSALWELDITDVVGESSSYRGSNPLGHHGDSTDYFVFVDDGDTYAYDHKYKTAYVPLTYLLADAPRRLSSRTADDPNGSLADDHVFAAWIHAKDRGDIPDDDPIPRRALRAMAREATEWGGDLVEHETRDGDTFDALPADVYNRALKAVEERHDVDPGREPLGTDPNTDPVAALPISRLAALDDDEARRFARRRGVEWPDTEQVRDRLQDTIYDALEGEERVVVDAPTSAGKSHQIAATPWCDVAPDVTGEQPVVHLTPTRDARDEQHARSCDELDHTHQDPATHRLLGGPEACPVAAGDHDPRNAEGEDDTQVVTIDGEPASKWFDRVCNDRGVPFSVAHGWAREHNDQGLPDLPCSPGDLECRSKTQYAPILRDDDTGAPTRDVVHATHDFAHVPSLRQNVNLVFDEQPDFTEELAHERARRAVTGFLALTDDGPDTWEQLVAGARAFDGNPFEKANPGNELATAGEWADPTERDRYMRAVEALKYDPRREWYLQDPDAHTLAPAIASAVFRALVEADPFGRTGRASARVKHHPPRFDDDAVEAEFWNREWVTVVVDETNTIRRVRCAPDLSGARAVIGLDAHPSARVWRRNAGPDLTREPVLEREDRRLWRLFERGLRCVQVGDAVRPKGVNAEYYDPAGDAALVERIRERFDLRSGVVPKAVREEFAGILEDHGADVGRADDGTPGRVLTYGAEKSRNDLAGEPVGMVSHCLDPGDEYVLDWLAECDLDAAPSRVECAVCNGKGCDECAGTGERREHGRTFDGPDAEAAAEFLGTVREQHLVQSAGRYARDPDDPDDAALVFVRSAALPDEYTDLKVPGVEWLATDAQRGVVDALARDRWATAGELADAAGVSKEHVRTTLERLADAEKVEVRETAGEHGAHLYRALAGKATEPGVVDLKAARDGETANGGVWETSTWSLVVSSPSAPSPIGETSRPAPAGPTPGEQLGLEAFDTPPPGD